MYRWWVFVHIVGVFGFLATHGVSMVVTFRLRRERDPGRVVELITFSSSSIGPFWTFLGLLLLGGVVAGFLGDWWGYIWIWGAIVVLVVVTIAMYLLARPYYRRVGLVARAMAAGSSAVTPEQFDRLLRSPRPLAVAGVGLGGILVILWFMMFKPFSPAAAPAPPGAITIGADALSFDTDTLEVPAGEPFELVFDNREGTHNVAIYTDESAGESIFVGIDTTGPDQVTYEVPAIPAGEAFFRCDIHPTQMTGTVVAS